MTPRRAVEFLLDCACQKHKWECSCVQGGRIRNDLPCSCGAAEHNRDVVVAIGKLRDCWTDMKIKYEVGVESPTWKFDDQV